MVSNYSQVKMDTLSSSFIQRYTLTPTISYPPPLPLVQFKISSVKLNEKFIHPKIRIHTKNTRKKSEQETEHITRKKKQPILTIIINFLDDFTCKFIDPPLRPSIDPKHVLSGNFSAVDELPPTACTVVEGSLPPCLNGAYIRNGPNPQFSPKGPYHLFDGDGMLHAITISQGKAKLCSRFVKTYKYKIERKMGAPIILNVFSAFNGFLASLSRCVVAFLRVIAGEYDPRRGIGNANTSLALFGGKLFALGESDLPYTLRINSQGDIITLGRHESYGEPFMTMTAHPKVDTKTGEAFAFRHSITRPFLSYFRISSQGIKQPEVPIYSLKEASLVHDFAVSKNYAVFADNQIVIRPKDIMRGKQPVRVDPKKVPRLGVIRRYAEGEMWWVEVPGFNMIHTVNAWEEDQGKTIVMVAANVLTVEHALERMDLIRCSMERVEINVNTKTVRQRAVSGRCLEFGVINPAYVGRKNRYMYAGIGAPMPKMAGVVKLDLSLSGVEPRDCTVATRLYGKGCYGGEPYFVAREPDNPTAEEDDGYLLTYVHNENIEESQFIVMDAKSPSLEIVAVVKLPQRVPYGFHGIFVRERDLKRL